MVRADGWPYKETIILDINSMSKKEIIGMIISVVIFFLCFYGWGYDDMDPPIKTLIKQLY